MPVRVMIVEAEESLRAALKDLLAAENSFEVTGAPGSVDEAVEQARDALPDVALLSVTMPGGGGARAAREIGAVSPETRLLVLSAFDDREHIVEMLRAGAIGYVVKGGSPLELIESVARAARGQSSFPAGLVSEFFAASIGPEERIPETLIEHAPDAVLLVDPAGRILLVNAQAERLFDYARAELVGASIDLLVPERLRAGHVEKRDGYRSSPHARPMGAGLNLFGRRRDGTEFPVDVSLSSVETGEGLLTAAFIRDDTERLERLEHERELAARRAVLARVVSAGEEERRQIAADIHDDSIQVMTAAGMRLQILRRSLETPDQVGRLEDLEETIQLSIARLRHLIFELRPPALDLDGLGAALRAYVEDLEIETGLRCEIDDQLTDEPPEATRVVLYRIAQEVLTNVRKHADASEVSIAISNDGSCYRVRIVDDGIGFTPDLTYRRPGHLGLASIRERAELAGGSLEIESSPGNGTTVEYWVDPDAAGGSV